MSCATCQQYAVIWPESDRLTAAAVCMSESTGNPGAECHNCFPGVTEWSIGLWQVNIDANTEFATWDLKDPATNARAAYQIWLEQGWGAWSSYTKGSYQAHLGECGGTTPAPSPSPVPIALPSSLSSLVAQRWFIPAAIVAAVILAAS